MKPQVQKIIAVFELAARIYLAYMLVEYGLSKLTGGMFNNATPEILNTPLKDVDPFHLTWYWFYKNKLLTCFVGFVQIAAAILLLFNKTVFIGIMLALPVMISILLIDIFVGIVPLIVRVAFYTCLLLSFIVYRWQTCTQVFSHPGLHRKRSIQNKPILLFVALVGAVIMLAVIELVLTRGISFLANQ